MIRRILAVLAVIHLAVPVWAGTVDVTAQAAPMVNGIRAGKGREPVVSSASLARAAAAHGNDMVRGGFFSHSGSNGSSVGDRVRAQGYGFCFVAENIAKGQKTLDSVLNSWMGSQGHRRNILSREARQFALIRADGDIWVMVLARSGC